MYTYLLCSFDFKENVCGYFKRFYWNISVSVIIKAAYIYLVIS